MSVPAHLKGFIEIIAGAVAQQINAEQLEAVAGNYDEQRESVMATETAGLKPGDRGWPIS